MAKDLIVVGGPNGSGKSTFAESYATIRNIPYLGADKIAYELDPHDPYSRRIEAGTQFVTRLSAALEGRDSLIVESTLAGKSLRRKIEDARKRGFTVTVFFPFLDSAELCLKRVGERVQKGGHNVPESDVRRRFGRSLVNFWDVYRTLAHYWYLLQNSSSDPFDIALGTANTVSVRDTTTFRRFQLLVDDQGHLASPVTEIETYHRGDEMMNVFRNAVRGVQAESRRLGVANVYCLEGRIYYEFPNGEITTTPPQEHDSPRNCIAAG